MEAVCILPESDYRNIQSSISNIESAQAKLTADSNREYLYTDEEFCQIMKVSKKTAQIWRAKGVVGYVQIGSVLRYRKEHIAALCEKFGVKATLN
ncbi:helix-turn-helix domain-containing protein [Spirosoma sp. BT702]|uniref:Helix-turn-helix domain-containing protein n=1 Tax=Spirosoma profusum TaxID=2771354 RepID=A0A927AU62_9BACT|nr:helix-turn-helix domain-containing protein [Spirosoma profusum]MBD2702642.1 helix-turn-helix domain-containing protein [Spirosoma profusum]